jgi:alpha-glucosidase (family GH31 glycosyl hydrolase)
MDGKEVFSHKFTKAYKNLSRYIINSGYFLFGNNGVEELRNIVLKSWQSENAVTDSLIPEIVKYYNNISINANTIQNLIKGLCQ